MADCCKDNGLFVQTYLAFVGNTLGPGAPKTLMQTFVDILLSDIFMVEMLTSAPLVCDLGTTLHRHMLDGDDVIFNWISPRRTTVSVLAHMVLLSTENVY